MGYYVHIHVCFACDQNEGVAKLAEKHRAALGESDDWEDGKCEAVWFLEDLSKRTGNNQGPKGGLSLWGMVGNYTRGQAFCEVLRPFWTELLRDHVEGGPFDFERVNVFVEPEQSEACSVFEIRWIREKEELVITEHKHMPFQFHQM